MRSPDPPVLAGIVTPPVALIAPRFVPHLAMIDPAWSSVVAAIVGGAFTITGILVSARMRRRERAEEAQREALREERELAKAQAAASESGRIAVLEAQVADLKAALASAGKDGQ